MELRGKTIGIVGALAAFPRRLAAREVEARGGVLRHGATRKTSAVVFGRHLLTRSNAASIEQKFDAAVAAGREPLSELGFLRLLGLAERIQDAAMTATALQDQSGLSARDLALLMLFDAFESHREPFSFRDVILARKYAGLIAGGATWFAIARSLQNVGAVSSLTALSLHVDAGEAIYAKRGEQLSELDGQTRLAIDETDQDDADLLFEAAEDAEAAGDIEGAASLYRRCLTADPGDSVAAFNLANCLDAAGDTAEARHAYALAIKIDPSFVEAWFNAANLLRQLGRASAARAHLEKAIAIDADYADAIYNLATLEYEAGDLDRAETHWRRYLELDPHSQWAKTALRGIQFVELDRKSRRSGTHS